MGGDSNKELSEAGEGKHGQEHCISLIAILILTLVMIFHMECGRPR